MKGKRTALLAERPQSGASKWKQQEVVRSMLRLRRAAEATTRGKRTVSTGQPTGGRGNASVIWKQEVDTLSLLHFAQSPRTKIEQFYSTAAPTAVTPAAQSMFTWRRVCMYG